MRSFLIARIEATLLYLDRVEVGRPRLARLALYPALALVLLREKIDPYRPPVAIVQEDDGRYVEQIGAVTLMENPGGGYGLLVHDQGEVSEYIVQRGGQGGGYSWESLVRAVLEMREVDSSSLSFDPEADMLAVYAPEPGPLRMVAGIVTDLYQDRELLDQAIAFAEERGIFE